MLTNRHACSALPSNLLQKLLYPMLDIYGLSNNLLAPKCHLTRATTTDPAHYVLLLDGVTRLAFYYTAQVPESTPLPPPKDRTCAALLLLLLLLLPRSVTEIDWLHDRSTPSLSRPNSSNVSDRRAANLHASRFAIGGQLYVASDRRANALRPIVSALLGDVCARAREPREAVAPTIAIPYRHPSSSQQHHLCLSSLCALPSQ